MVQTTTSLSAMLSSTPPKARPSYAHPLDPLTASEIRHVVDAVRSHLVKSAKAPKPITKALFNSISLREPSKYAVLQWAGTFSRKELSTAGAQVDAPLNRQADVSDPHSSVLHWHRLTNSGSHHLPRVGSELRSGR